MNDDKSENSEGTQEELQAPPLPEEIEVEPKEEPEMSEVATLGNIFIEPGKTFEDLRRKPRYMLAALIMIIVFSAFQVLFIEKVGFKEIAKARIESSSFTRDLPPDQMEAAIEQQSSSISKYITYGATPIVILVIFLLGTLLYWGLSAAFGGVASFFQILSVWIYSSLPPAIVATLANLVILFLKAPEEIDLVRAQSEGLVQANPSMFIDGKEMPVLSAIVSSIDFFQIWGFILAVIGLKVMTKISGGVAWAIVLLIGLIPLTLKVIGALF